MMIGPGLIASVFNRSVDSKYPLPPEMLCFSHEDIPKERLSEDIIKPMIAHYLAHPGLLRRVLMGGDDNSAPATTTVEFRKAFSSSAELYFVTTLDDGSDGKREERFGRLGYQVSGPGTCGWTDPSRIVQIIGYSARDNVLDDWHRGWTAEKEKYQAMMSELKGLDVDRVMYLAEACQKELGAGREELIQLLQGWSTIVRPHIATLARWKHAFGWTDGVVFDEDRFRTHLRDADSYRTMSGLGAEFLRGMLAGVWKIRNGQETVRDNVVGMIANKGVHMVKPCVATIAEWRHHFGWPPGVELDKGLFSNLLEEAQKKK